MYNVKLIDIGELDSSHTPKPKKEEKKKQLENVSQEIFISDSKLMYKRMMKLERSS